MGTEEMNRGDNGPAYGRRFSAGAAAALLLLLAGVFALGYTAGNRLKKENGNGPLSEVPAVSTESSVAESFPPEEISEVPEAAESEEQFSLAEELAGIVGAVIPDVGAYFSSYSGRGHIVCIDPGHQDHGMSDTEPVGPGASEMKAKLTTGTQGRTTGNTEYQVNLDVGMKLKSVLEARGYRVVMTRESNDVEISNAERAVMAAEAGAECFVRLHCNGSDNSGARGVLAYVPTHSNPYLTEEIISGSQRLADLVIAGQCAATGQNSLGTIPGDDMTGINWAKMPVTIIEMGYMTNPDEDRFLGSEEGQERIAEGIAAGIDGFFSE